jgi:hypothetical protein
MLRRISDGEHKQRERCSEGHNKYIKCRQVSVDRKGGWNVGQDECMHPGDVSAKQQDSRGIKGFASAQATSNS